MTNYFDRFVGIDWSGAKGKRQKTIAVSVAEHDKAPVVVEPSEGGVYDVLGRNNTSWSRAGVYEYLSLLLDQPGRTLVGVDAAFTLPFVDAGAYLPGQVFASDAQGLWSAVDKACPENDHYYGGGFVDVYGDYFRRPGNVGQYFAPRLRQAEHVGNDGTKGLGRMESPFHLIGPTQVGMAGFSIMRLLARFAQLPQVAVWPMMPTAGAKLVFVEVFATRFARQGGARAKLRTWHDLNEALLALDSPTTLAKGAIDDHKADAVVTAAGLRQFARNNAFWTPRGLTDKIRQTEGWVFGVE